jgi:hypothetical protein
MHSLLLYREASEFGVRVFGGASPGGERDDKPIFAATHVDDMLAIFVPGWQSIKKPVPAEPNELR